MKSSAPQPISTSHPGATALNLSNPIPPLASSPAPRSNPVLFGSQGLRAGWSLLLFLLILACIASLLTLVFHLLHLHPATHVLPHEQPLNQVLFFESLSFASVLLTSWLLSRIERRPLRFYGLGQTPGALHQLSVGLLAGLTLLSLLAAALRASHLLAFQGFLLTAPAALRYGLLWLLAFFAVALAEEYLVRGFLQFTLARGLAGLASLLPTLSARTVVTLGFWLAAVLLSSAFGFGHHGNPGESPIGLLSAALIGLVFCLSLWRTGSLWWAVGFHTAWDWAQSFLFGVPDSGGLMQHHLLASQPVGPVLWSGGLTGPEGSFLVLPTVLLTVGALLLTTRASSILPQELATAPPPSATS